MAAGTVSSDSLYFMTNSHTGWNYPVNSFENALGVARAVSEAGGANSVVQKSVIAHALAMSDSSGGFAQRLATARTYGMIEGGQGGYRLTEFTKQYFHPSSEAEKRLALLIMLKSAPIFAEIIKRFDGNKIPTSDMLANVLLREFKVPESWKGRVARFFLKAAADAGILDGQGYLRYSAARQSIDTMPDSSSTSSAESSSPIPASPSAPSGGGPIYAKGGNALVFSEGDQSVRLETSGGELSSTLWGKLNIFVQALKPEGAGK